MYLLYIEGGGGGGFKLGHQLLAMINSRWQVAKMSVSSHNE